MFRCFVRQEIGFFDIEENSAGELTLYLSEKVSLVQAMNGEKIAIVLKVLSTIVTGCAKLECLACARRSHTPDRERLAHRSRCFVCAAAAGCVCL